MPPPAIAFLCHHHPCQHPPPLAVEAKGAAAVEAALGAEVDAQGAGGQGRGGQEEEEEEEGAQARQEGAHGALRREGRGGWLRWVRGIPEGGGGGHSSHGNTETIPPSIPPIGEEWCRS